MTVEVRRGTIEGGTPYRVIEDAETRVRLNESLSNDFVAATLTLDRARFDLTREMLDALAEVFRRRDQEDAS